jgi:hypothetical protein
MTVSFDINKFGDAMNQQAAIKLDEYDGNAHGWKDKDGQAMHYSHVRDKADDWDYRTWRHDISAFSGNAGILVSCKIDHDRFGDDDHLVVLASFDPKGQFISAQASIQRGSDKANAQTALCTTSNSGDIPQAVGDAVLSAIRTIEKGKTDEGLEYLGTIATVNLRCMQSGVVVS